MAYVGCPWPMRHSREGRERVLVVDYFFSIYSELGCRGREIFTLAFTLGLDPRSRHNTNPEPSVRSDKTNTFLQTCIAAKSPASHIAPSSAETSSKGKSAAKSPKAPTPRRPRRHRRSTRSANPRPPGQHTWPGSCNKGGDRWCMLVVRVLWGAQGSKSSPIGHIQYIYNIYIYILYLYASHLHSEFNV